MPRDFVWPGHKYFGPGNKLFHGKPVDRDDEIVEEHDIAYAINKNIHEADEKAIDEFLEDWNKTGNWHSYIGGVLLEGKKHYENIFGQIYPMHRGRENYAKAQKRLSELWKEAQKRGDNRYTNWWEFQKLHSKDIFGEGKTNVGTSGNSGPSGININSKRKNTENNESPAKQSRTVENSSTQELSLSADHLRALDDLYSDTFATMDVDSVEEVANPAEGASRGSAGRTGGRSIKPNISTIIPYRKLPRHYDV